MHQKYEIIEDGITYLVEDRNGEKYWSLSGKLHREFGPAIEYSNGSKWWYRQGKRHREDGPAGIVNTGDKIIQVWFFNDKYIDCSSQKEFEKY